MSHDLFIDGAAGAPKANARVLAFSAVAVLMVVALAVSGVDYTAPSPQDDAVTPQAEDWRGEDWHGNVKRSHWRSQ